MLNSNFIYDQKDIVYGKIIEKVIQRYKIEIGLLLYNEKYL